jgi:signal transduction histidine kinase
VAGGAKVPVDGGSTLDPDITRSGGRTVHVPGALVITRRGWPAPPQDSSHGFFGSTRRFLHQHPEATDVSLAVGLLVVCTAWLATSPFAGLTPALVQIALIAPLVWRRRAPSIVLGVVAVVGMFQWLFGPPLLADAALLVALYSVAVHEPRMHVVWAAGVLELGAVLASTRWRPADTVVRSLAFLTATVVAAVGVGLTVRSGSEYLAWLAERARRLEIERDQQAVIVAAQERTRIAREMHDIVAHSLSVLVTLADAASTVSRSDPDRAAVAMSHASTVGRQALADMRSLIGVLRTDVTGADVTGADVTGADVTGADLVPQPGLAQLDDLLTQVRATGLAVEIDVAGPTSSLAPALQLSIYRIIQESLTNTLKHAGATRAHVVLRCDGFRVTVSVSDDGPGASSATPRGPGGRLTDPMTGGHGIKGMRERVLLHRGSLSAGPAPDGGWTVTGILRCDDGQAVA